MNADDLLDRVDNTKSPTLPERSVLGVGVFDVDMNG